VILKAMYVGPDRFDGYFCFPSFSSLGRLPIASSPELPHLNSFKLPMNILF
jgi:hypothetical protein